MIRLMLISLLALSLAGCVTKSGPSLKSLTVVKPSSKQIKDNATNVVCKSFKYIYYSAKIDRPETVKQARGHNAALASFGCPK
jgi:hypothetical protein